MKTLRILVETATIGRRTPLKIDTGAAILRGYWYNDHILKLMDREVKSYQESENGVMHIVLA